MALTVDDVKALLVSLLPPGSSDLYALRNVDNIGGLFYGISRALKAYGLDRLDQLRLELNPSTMVEKIPDWESACGLSNTPIAMFGTLDQRRNAVLAVLRSHSSFSLDDIRSAVQPYFLYADPSQIQIVETNRTNLRTAHTYVNATPIILGVNTSGSTVINVLDDPRVSPAGATVQIELTGLLEEVSFTVTGPDGSSGAVHFAPGYLGAGTVAFEVYTLFCKQFAGQSVHGPWRFEVRTGPTMGATVDAWTLFVEGLGVTYNYLGERVGQGLGAAIYEFAVVADPALLGTGYDLNAAYHAIQTIKPAHVLGSLVVKNGVSGLCAIPDEPETIPDACVPC